MPPHSSYFTRARLLRIFLPLQILAYFGSLALAAHLFPQTYDWRYRVISNLLSPRDNPTAYRIPSFGIALAGLLLIPIGAYLAAHLPRNPDVPTAYTRTLASYAFLTGAILLILAAVVVPQHVHPVLGLRRLHETLARTSAAAIGLGMLASLAAVLRPYAGLFPQRRPLQLTWAALTILPLAGIAISEVLLYLSSHSPWGAPIRAAMRNSVFWHLGFWEWLGSVAVFLFLISGVAWLPEGDAC